MRSHGRKSFKSQGPACRKLGLNPAFITIPIGLEDKFEGVIDLIEMRAIYFDGPNGEELRYAEIPIHLRDDAERYREELLEAASMFSDELAEAYLEGNPTKELLSRLSGKEQLKKSSCLFLLVRHIEIKAYNPCWTVINFA